MKIQSIFSFNYQWALLLAMGFGLLLSVGCNKDDDMVPAGEDPIASFQFEVSEDNFLEVSFMNFSQNAASYQWEFGDGQTSTEENPTHVYAEAGEYTVALTASNTEGQSARREETITLTDPDAQLTLLAGADSKTWYLQREGIALGIGPEVNDNQWWSFGGVTPLGDRPCILDDQYTFHRDGTFEFNSNGTLYIDAIGDGGWKDAGSCWDETDPDVWMTHTGENVSEFANGGDYTFELNGTNNTLTLSGLGAYIGLPNKTENGDNFLPVTSKTYTVFNLAEGDIADTLQIALDGDGFAWNFNLVSYRNPADLPDIPSSEPRAAFSFEAEGLTVNFNNTSANATSHSWDFGDGSVSVEENPSHAYATEGTYTVTLTVMDDIGNSDMTSKEVSVSEAQFTTEVLASESGKVWVLDGIDSYRVGPAPGSGEWFSISEEDLTTRACNFDDEFIFFADGTFQYDAKGQVWGEPYMGVDPPACVDEASLTAPYDVLGSSTDYTFTSAEAAGDDRPTVTVMGEGAFLGLHKPFNGGELDGVIAPVSEITYEVFDYSAVGGVEKLILVIDISDGETGGAWWTVVLRSEN